MGPPARHLAVQVVNDLELAVAEDGGPVRDAAGGPALKQVAAASAPRRLHDAALLAAPRADKQHEPAALAHAAHDARGAPQVRRRRLERDDVHAVADAEDVALVARVPQRLRVAQVRLRRQQQLGRHGGGFWRLLDQQARVVVRGVDGAAGRLYASCRKQGRVTGVGQAEIVCPRNNIILASFFLRPFPFLPLPLGHPHK